MATITLSTKKIQRMDKVVLDGIAALVGHGYTIAGPSTIAVASKTAEAAYRKHLFKPATGETAPLYTADRAATPHSKTLTHRAWAKAGLPGGAVIMAEYVKAHLTAQEVTA